MGREPFAILISDPSQRHIERGSWFSEQTLQSRGRVGSEPRSLCKDRQEVGAASGGSIRIQGEWAASSILFSAQKWWLPGDGCFGAPVLCLHTISADPTGIKEDPEGKSFSYSDYPILAQESMVFQHSATGHWPSHFWHLPLRLIQGPVNYTEVARFSECLLSTLLSSRKKVTRTIYAKVWKVYNSFWCSTNRALKNSASVLEFLQ